MTLTRTLIRLGSFRSLVDQRSLLLEGRRGDLCRSSEDVADREVRVVGEDLCDALLGAALGVCWEVGHALDGVGLGVGHGEDVGGVFQGKRTRLGRGLGVVVVVVVVVWVLGSGESVRQWNEYATLSLRDVVLRVVRHRVYIYIRRAPRVGGRGR